MAAAPERIKAAESRGGWRRGARGDQAMRDEGARSPGEHTVKAVERFQFCGIVSHIHMVKEKQQLWRMFKEIGRRLKEGAFCYIQAGLSHLFPQLG